MKHESTAWPGVAAVVFAVLAWGMVPVATRFLVIDIPPAFVMILRVVPAGLLGLMVVIALGARAMPWRAWVRLMLASVIGNVGYQVLSIYGAQYLPASWVGVLFGLEPVFLALFSVLFSGDRMTSWLWGGMTVALIGTATMTMGSLVASIRDVNAVGIIMVTLGSMGWGIYTILIRPVSAQYGPVPVACLTLGISAFPVLLFATPELPHVMASLTTAQILTILSVVVFCTIGGTVAWNFALGYLDANRAGMFLYGQPIVAAVAGFALLHEQPSLYLVAGGILIIVGVVISQFGPALFPKLSELEPDTGHHLDPHYYP